MTKYLSGKTALVTGGSRGLGRAIVQDLADLGALVAINYAANKSAALETLASIEEKGGAGFIIQSELGSLESAESLKTQLDAELIARTGTAELDILVNNAGGGPLAGIDDTTPEILEKIVADNMTGPFYLTKVLKNQIRSNGRVVNMSSQAAKHAIPHYPIYSMCKSAINTFTVILAKELGPKGITVNCIMPGMIATDANIDLRANSEMITTLVSNTPLGRIGNPSDISGVVKCLVSPDMSYVTGQIFEVSGGLAL